MKPLIVLLIVFFIALIILKISGGKWKFALSARIAMSAMLAFTAIGHFAFTKGMAMMLPDWMPYKYGWVYGTGIAEILAAIGLHWPGLRKPTAWLLIIMFLVILPANIYAAIRHVDYQQANYEGNGSSYLWFRIPMQIFLIAWVYGSCLYNQSTKRYRA